MDTNDVLGMIKRRAKEAGLAYSTIPSVRPASHVPENGGTLEHAQQIAAHESPRTTKLYDRTPREHVSVDEVERIKNLKRYMRKVASIVMCRAGDHRPGPLQCANRALRHRLSPRACRVAAR
jgi:hypothetical protein